MDGNNVIEQFLQTVNVVLSKQLTIKSFIIYSIQFISFAIILSIFLPLNFMFFVLIIIGLVVCLISCTLNSKKIKKTVPFTSRDSSRKLSEEKLNKIKSFTEQQFKSEN